MKRTKILYISSYLDVGGLEVLLLNFLKRLDRDKYDPSICVFCENGSLEPEFKKINIPVYVVKKKEGLDWLLPFKLRKLIKKQGINIIHTHNATPWLYAGLASMLVPKVKLVHTKHSNIGLRRKGLLRAETMLAKRSNSIIAVAGDVAEFMQKEQNIDAKKIKVVYNGIDTDSFKSGEVNKSKKGKHIGIVARLEPVKDHKTLLDAFKILTAKNNSLKLYVIGDGSLKNQLIEHSRELGIAENVIFTGQRRDIAALMSQLDIFVLSSVDEGMPITLLEAMATGLPIVATNVGGIQEVIQDDKSGILVPSQNPEALADAINNVLSDSELAAKLGRTAREQVEKRFSMRKMVREYEKIYDRANPQKILIISELPPPVGGIGVQAELLIDNLRKDGFNVSVIKTNISFIKTFAWLDKIKVIKSIIRFIVFLFKLVAIVPTIEVIHIFSNSYAGFFLYTTPAVVLGKLFKKQVIINYHGGCARDFLNKQLYWAKLTLEMANGIVVPSGYLRDIFAEFDIKSQVITNILDLGIFRYEQEKGCSPTFLTARHLEVWYDVECIIRAFAIVKKKYTQAILNIAGDGTQRQNLEDLVKKLNLVDSVVFCGCLNNREIAKLHEKADIFLNASRVDNMPVAIIEAFASGTAVVTTAAGGIPYLVEDGKTGFLVELNNHEQMAEKIYRLLEDRELFYQIIENARAKTVDYKWENVKRSLLEVYKQ